MNRGKGCYQICLDSSPRLRGWRPRLPQKSGSLLHSHARSKKLLLHLRLKLRSFNKSVMNFNGWLLATNKFGHSNYTR
uniref:Uncharacterized protein n=1 Tax=Picea sitchensis TaxID=3332 RepID=A9NSD8_PICSI|nr:unknown [Picea sitchensis]